MTKDTISELLALGTGPELNIDEKETFVDAFLRQVEKIPDATAVVDEFCSITYGELDRRSDSLARERSWYWKMKTAILSPWEK